MALQTLPMSVLASNLATKGPNWRQALSRHSTMAPRGVSCLISYGSTWYLSSGPSFTRWSAPRVCALRKLNVKGSWIATILGDPLE